MNEIDGIQVDVFGVGEVVFLNLDVTNEILQDPKVREAILLAINRENTVALSGSPVSEPVFSVVPARSCRAGSTKRPPTRRGSTSPRTSSGPRRC